MHQTVTIDILTIISTIDTLTVSIMCILLTTSYQLNVIEDALYIHSRLNCKRNLTSETVKNVGKLRAIAMCTISLAILLVLMSACMQ